MPRCWPLWVPAPYQSTGQALRRNDGMGFWDNGEALVVRRGSLGKVESGEVEVTSEWRRVGHGEENPRGR